MSVTQELIQKTIKSTTESLEETKKRLQKLGTELVFEERGLIIETEKREKIITSLKSSITFAENAVKEKEKEIETLKKDLDLLSSRRK